MRLDARPQLDEHGFLAAASLRQTFTVDSLFDQQAVLAVAPPWCGKTYMAKQLDQHFRSNMERPTRPAPFGQFFHCTLFERFGSNSESKPTWWDKWQGSNKRACWVIDAIDEDERLGHRQAHGMLDLIADLPSGTRGRLFLLVFARKNEVPEEFCSRLAEVYPESNDSPSAELQHLRLAPLDAGAALEVVGSKDKFRRACDLIEEHCLREIACLPVVLETLARQPEDAKLSRVRVWREVLTNLLFDRRLEGNAALNLPPIDDRFRATSRIAAALTFSGNMEIDAGLGHSSGPSIEDIFPADGPSCPRLRRAARAAIRSAVFQRTATGYRLAQFHVQEWFAAFELADVPLSRLRPLVTGHEGNPLQGLGGVFGILRETTKHQEVREWIREIHGGLPPRSDAAPWALADVIETLDRLQDLARTSERTHLPVSAQSLANLATPGLGAVLAKRMPEQSLTLPERELLVDVALAIRAHEAAAPALAIALNPDEDDHLRLSATYLVLRIGTEEQLKTFENMVVEAEPVSRYERRVASVIIRRLYEEGQWPFAKALAHLPEPVDAIIDETHLFEDKLLREMTPDNARAFLRSSDPQEFAAKARRHIDPGRGHWRMHGGARFLLKALRLLSGEDCPSDADCELMLPFAMDQAVRDLAELNQVQFLSAFHRNKKARRGLYRRGLSEDPTGKSGYRLEWRWALVPEDLDWLGELCRDHGTRSPWLWEDLLRVAYDRGVGQPARNRMRARVRGSCPDILAKWDEGRRRHLGRERRREETRRRRAQQNEERQYPLPEAISDTLSHPELGLHEQMIRLSCCCFVEAGFRPPNVTGEWDDLDADLQRQVVATCEEGLQQANPTAIPDGNSYPITIMHEAAAFVRAVRDSDTYELVGVQVRKWLQAVLTIGSPPDEEVLARCSAADRDAFEDVLVLEMRREMRSDDGSVMVASNLPAEHWSDRLATKAAALLGSTDLAVAARCELMRVLGQHSPRHVLKTAKEWSRLPSTDGDAELQERAAGIDVLLAIAPEPAVPELGESFEQHGKAFLLKLLSLQRNHGDGLTAELDHWPAQSLADLFDLLCQAYPAESDPVREPGKGYFVGSEDELRETRDSIPAILMKRGTEDDKKVLEGIASRYPRIASWYTRFETDRAAAEIVGQVKPSQPRGRTTESVPVPKLVRLLDDSRYRLLRSDADLQRILVDELRGIEKDAKDHLAMLYHPRIKRGSKDTNASGRTEHQRKRLHEDALQTYIQCRLRDRLPGRVLEGSTTVVFIDREALVGEARRLDIKVQAPTVPGSPATVVIEVKWSNNKDVSTSLAEQLGKDYLLGGGLTHGIYFVGWYKKGSWKRTAIGTAPQPRDSMASWQTSLESQAREFRDAHPELCITPMIIDLRSSSGDV